MHRPAAPLLRLTRALPALALFVALNTCPVLAQTDEEAIKQTLVDMWAAIEAGDLEQYETYIHDDFTSFGETETYLKEGKRLELLGVEGWTSRYADIRTEMHHPEVTVRGDTAWITYYWTDESINRSTGARETTRGKSTRIFVREDGRWLCIHGHYTLVA